MRHGIGVWTQIHDEQPILLHEEETSMNKRLKMETYTGKF